MAKSLFRTDDEIAEIYKRHVKTIYRVCYTYKKNHVDTEDAVSETFLKLIRHGPVFNGEEHEKAWLIRTASNVCKDFLKHWSRRNADIEDYATTLEAERGDEASSLLDTVCALPDKYKTVVYLYYYEGYNSNEIATSLGKPQSTIRNYLHEAREILRKKLGEDFDEE